MSLPIYIDIDGTLTTSSTAHSPPMIGRINRVQALIANGFPVVVWSANGTEYARQFCACNSLDVLAAIGKPDYCVDDNPDIRPSFRVVAPSSLD